VGIIDSLSAGYRIALRRIDLLLIPVLLDLLLWLAPRWSVGPILERLATFYQQAAQEAQLGVAMADVSATNLDLLAELGRSFNLLTGLVSGSLLHVPSLALTASLPAGAGVWEMTSAATAFGIWLLLLMVGLLLGVIFLEQAARVVPLGAGAKPEGMAALARAALRHWWRVLGFVLLVTVLLMVAIVPISAVVGLLMLVLPGLGMVAWGLTLGLLLMLFLFLYFVTAAIVLDDMGVFDAIRTSARLVRGQLLSVLGWVLLVNVIGAGVAVLLRPLADMQPIGTVAAIVFNAFVGAGMAVGLLVFYRSHLVRETQAVAAETL
jgi:hypothetical protein